MALASVVTVVVLLTWGIGALTAPGEPALTPVDADAAGPAPSSGPTAFAVPSPAPPSEPLPAPSTGPDTAPPAEPTSAVPPVAAPPTAGSATGPSSLVESTPADTARTEGGPDSPTAGTSERIHPDDTPRTPVATPSPVPVPQTGPVPCTNDMIRTGAEVDRPGHRVGERPVFRLVITNVSGQPCVRDLDSARQEIVVWSADLADRLWSSNDCVNVSSIDLRTLVPGQPVAFAVAWAGRTTTPGCAQPRTVVPAGSYQVMTRLDDVISPPTPFTRLP